MSIWEILDNSILEGPPFGEERSTGLYPSEASAKVNGVVYGKCMRAVFFRWKEATSQTVPIEGEQVIVESGAMTAKSEWIFELGRRAEDMILDRAKLAGIFRWGHMKFKIPLKELTISGELDAIFTENGKDIGIEIKSISGQKAEMAIMNTPAMRARGFKGEPKLEHIMQTAIYAWYYRNKLSYFKILYIMRDKAFRTEFKIQVKEVDGVKRIFVDDREFKKFTLDDLVIRYKELETHIRENTLPPRDYDLVYDDATMNTLVANNSLTKTDSEAWKKYWEREQEHLTNNKTRRLKRPVVGSWECSYCNYSGICYNTRKVQDESEDQASPVLPTDMELEV